MSIISSMRYCLGPPDSFGPIWAALGFMPFGLFFDFMDGKVARWRGKSSLMGQELDSLADLVCEAPTAMVFYKSMPAQLSLEWGNRAVACQETRCPSSLSWSLFQHQALTDFLVCARLRMLIRLFPGTGLLRRISCRLRFCAWPTNPT